MATGATETRLEVTVSESPGRRRQGKFQPFRRLFGKRKKRAAEKSFDAAEFKASFSTEEVCNGVVSDDEETNQHLREPSTAGNRALSHDSVFIPEEPAQEGGPEQTMSQENVSDKVRSLQRQIGQNIKFGQKPPSQRKSEGEEGSSDEEDAPRSPLKVLAQVEAEPDDTEPKVQGAEQRHGTPVKSPRSKRMLPATGTIESINLDSVPQSVPRLDNTAAKHKLAVKPKNQRVSRKHRRFTQELSPLDVPPEVKEGDGEDAEATGMAADTRRRTPGSSDDDYGSLEGSKKQRIQEAEGRESRREREKEEERMRAIEKEEEEERRRRQQEEARLRKEEEEERKREEAERRRKQEEEDMRAREEEERAQREREERRVREEERRREEEEREREERRERLRLEEEGRLREEREEAERRTLETEKRLLEEEEEKERKRRSEELRWREMEERQRPFSFKVSSSGEKQILFQKVNLTPVDPTEGGGHAPKAPSSSSSSSSPSRTADPPNLPSSQYVPHTAILVTGAQLCGPAVNLDQIKDPACKSLLGLGDDKKAMAAAPTKSKTSPERKSGKTKSLNEALLSTDQSSAAILAEWASIRSKIFKGAEEGKNDDYPEPGGHSPIRNPPPNGGGAGENQTTAFPHTNLRKTMSASAKFSITPARKKFSDSKRNSELLSQEDGGKTEAGAASSGDAPLQPVVQQQQPQGKVGKTVRVVAQRSEGCMFAKDLPSFLVPNAAQGPADDERADSGDEDRRRGGSQDTPPPFGIKLRRTNYSLRFHGEQPTEKRKKRYSAGDSFEGVPSPLAPIEPESAPPPALSDAPPGGGPASSPLRESRPANELRTRAGKAPSSSVAPCGAETPPAKPSSVYQRPGASSRPAPGPPPPPPLAKSGRGGGGGEERERRGEETTTSAVAQLQRSGQGEEEPREKKSFFPSISIPWREKPDRKTELARREKPSLQSRHSLDSVRGQDKEAGPMWVTLALQKQKGFREQQQSRDERRSQREAKLAEKQARDRDGSGLSSPSGSKGSGTSSPTLPPEPPHEAKRPDSLLGRFERREHLKKANTLPSSVTVEIADSTPSPPAVKEVSKRFPASDSPQVCTEPAWLALAKRKAKAWSDCPQIIK